MNIAFTTLVILLLLLPGIFFSRFYYAAAFSKEYFKPNLFELILSTLIQSVLLHILWLGVLGLFDYKMDYNIALYLALGIDNIEGLKQVSQNLEGNIGKIVGYNLSLWLIAGTLGWACRFIVRKSKLDRKYQLFRYQNQWHYLVSGEILDFPNVPGEAKEVNLIFVDVLVNSQEGSLIYSGILFDYVLSKDGGMKLIYLRDVKRRFLSEDNYQEGEAPHYFMPGKVLAIPYERIENMHVTYYFVKEEEKIEESD